MCDFDLIIGGLVVVGSLVVGFTGFLVLSQVVKRKREKEFEKSKNGSGTLTKGFVEGEC